MGNSVTQLFWLPVLWMRGILMLFCLIVSLLCLKELTVSKTGRFLKKVLVQNENRTQNYDPG